jgi:Protein of Unknown function (DUF2784)
MADMSPRSRILPSVAADLVVVLHFAFVVFAALGGLFTLRWPRIAWIHLPAAAWGAYVEFSGAICPLTPLENRLRAAGGLPTYEGGFIDRYLMPLLYPAGLTRETQLWLGVAVVGINVAAYWFAFGRRPRGR